MYDIPGRLWDAVTRGVENLTLPQTAVIGGAGSGISLASSFSVPDLTVLNTLFQTIAFGAGAIGGLLSVGLMLMKFDQTRRERDKFIEDAAEDSAKRAVNMTERMSQTPEPVPDLPK